MKNSNAPAVKRAIPSWRADQGRDCGAAEIQRIAENAPRCRGAACL